MSNTDFFKSKRVAITGGTGSFGLAMVKRLLTTNVGKIKIISRDEKKQEDMRISLQDSRLEFFICDVRDPTSLRNSLEGSDILFHAAAMKQVPTCEFNPGEAVKTNILGPLNVVNAMRQIGHIDGVFLSTDKAVYPINAMGISKAMMEKIVLSYAKVENLRRIRLMCTRYGNVMASRGSVIPLFIKQIRSNSPVTITDPSMTRFLMSIDQAVDLVMHAFEFGHTGDTFVLKAPSCSVDTLVDALAAILQATPRKKIIGLRHGEKNYETLVSAEEMSRAIESEKVFRIPVDSGEMNYHNSDLDPKFFSQDREAYTSQNTKILDVSAVIKMIQPIVSDILHEPNLY